MPATLASIRIKNFALVEDAHWSPGPGFNVVSGETGAGKSILIGALKLLLGERADRSLIRNGEADTVIEALFENCDSPQVGAILETAGAEACEEGSLILKRVVAATGGKQFVNGSPCTISLLRDLGDLLVDLHGPHDHQSLFSREHQTALLDAFCDTSDLFEEYRTARKSWQALIAEKESLDAGAQALARELDLLRHQVEEIEAAALIDGEEESLLNRHKAAANAEKIQELCASALRIISGEDALLDRLGELGRTVKELGRLDPAAAELESRQLEIRELCADLERDLTTILDTADAGETALGDLEERLDLIGGLKRKYGSSISEILSFTNTAAERLAELEAKESRNDNLDAAIQSALDQVAALGKKLSTRRKTGSDKLAKSVASQLKELGFRQAGFSIDLETAKEPAPTGYELAEFLFAPNPGEPPRPLRQIASSGEISRVMLALKCALASQDQVALLVFDEIDANVGGETATKVAIKMAGLGNARQVLCITHLPQVAAAGGRHFVVEKQVEKGRTQSVLREVNQQERELEVARMLGGKSESALTHARNLLNTNGKA